MKDNNFDFLRLIFSLFVLITHSTILSGNPEHDIFSLITQDQSLLSDLGVKGFFVISGFLIYQSLERSKNIFDFLWKRFLRIYPALFVLLVLTIFLGYFVYDSSFNSYLHNRSVYKYVPYNLSLFKLQYYIDGIFENNPFPNAINGSLWTLQFEVLFYAVTSVLIFFKKRKWILFVIFSILLLGNFYLQSQPASNYLITLTFRLGTYYFYGSILASINFQITRGTSFIAFLSLMFLIIGAYFHHFQEIITLTLPLIIVYISLYSLPYIKNLSSKIGDYSYGIYILAFPVQQTLVHFFQLNNWSLLIYSLIITLILAFASWHMIEKRVLKYKKLFSHI